MVPDSQVGVLGGQHCPASEGLHHRHRLLVQREADLARHQGGLVGDVEHGVVNLQSNSITLLSLPLLTLTFSGTVSRPEAISRSS